MQTLHFVNTSGLKPGKDKQAKKLVRSHAMKDYRRKQRQHTKRQKVDSPLTKDGPITNSTAVPVESTELMRRRSDMGSTVLSTVTPVSTTIPPGPTPTSGTILQEILSSVPVLSDNAMSQMIATQGDQARSLSIESSTSPANSCDSAVSQTLTESFDARVCSAVYAALDNAGADFDRFTEFYFNSVHTYLTIIHRPSFYKKVAALKTRADADLALLVLCVKLVTEPIQHEAKEELGSKTYWTAKRIFEEILNKSLPSIELVQAGALLTLYEHNTCMQGEYETLRTCSTLAKTLGLDIAPESKVWVVEEESRRVYWGLRSLDCIVALHDEKHERPLLLPVPTEDDILPWPSDSEFEQAGIHARYTPSATPYTVKSSLPAWVDSFCRQGQTAYILSMVLVVLETRFETNPEYMRERVLYLDCLILDTLRKTLADCSGRYTQHCGPISFCIIASYLLHEYQLLSTFTSTDPGDREAASRSKLAIAKIIEMMVDILRVFPLSHTPELSPAALYCPYMAARLILLLDRINGLIRSPTLADNTLELMVNALKTFSSYWPCTAEYGKLIERVQARALPMPLAFAVS